MSRALTDDQIKKLTDLADRLEFWGKANKDEPRRKHLRTLGTEQMNTATEIRQILRSDGAIDRIEELEAQIKRADDQIEEELTHGPIATYYALRFRAALEGDGPDDG
jgi:hypothetical protein